MKLSVATRSHLPSSAFAIPEWRWGPLTDASHVRNAASRLEQARRRGEVTGARYASARRRIASAARRYGIHSEYLANPVRFWDSRAGLVTQGAGIGLMAGYLLWRL